MIISFQMMCLSCLYLHFVKSYGSARVRDNKKKTKIFDFCDLICWKVFRSCFLETQEHPGKFALSCPGICRVLACPGKS